MITRKKICLLLVFVMAILAFSGCATVTSGQDKTENSQGASVVEDGEYNDKEHVAEYIHTFGKLPSNYITKDEAEDQGWESHKGNLAEVLPGKSIGGDHFGNHEGTLPKGAGISYKECDIDYQEGTRNAKRIIYSNDGSIYYTEDHYKTFEQLY